MINVFVSGSCVSRDLLGAELPEDYQLLFYSPRQSLIPVLRKYDGPIPKSLDLGLPSRFQRRALTGTLSGDFSDQLHQRAEDVDLILWDLTDERLGVYSTADGYVTRSLELISSGLDAIFAEEARLIAFGTQEHLDLWTAALMKWRKQLYADGLANRVILLAPSWAENLDDGSVSPSSFGLDSIEHSFLIEAYYATAESVLPGLPIVGRGVTTRGSRSHKWGPAPFHFDGVTNRVLAAGVRDVTHGDVTFPPPRPLVSLSASAAAVLVTRTWADVVALYTMRDGEIVHRYRYQGDEIFEVPLEASGLYRFRAFHRKGDVTVGVNSVQFEVR